jgi:ABC-type molybdate transport system substrate-binding protein
MMQGASQIATGAAVNGVISGALYYMSDRESENDAIGAATGKVAIAMLFGAGPF